MTVIVLTVLCSSCVPASTATGSPCSFNGANPFCTDENPFGITYSSGISGTAQPFFGTNSVGCLGSVTRPAWYYMRINNPGNLLIYIQQQNLQGVGIDVDFACWGPFSAPTETAFLDNLCCGYYQLNISSCSSHRPTDGNHTNDMGGYPVGNLVDCSYYANPTEWCYIPNALADEYYILLITNFNGSAGTITFSPVLTSSTATTDCSLLASGMSNSPVCVGDTIRLYCQNPQVGATYTWTGPNNWTSTTEDPVIVNATTSMSGTYSLVKHFNGQNSDTVHIPVVVNPIPVVTVSSNRDTVCSNQTATITAGGGDTYHWSNGMSGASITVTPQTNTTYHVTATTAANCHGSANLSLVAAPVRTTSLSDTICAGEPYNRYGFSLSAENTQDGVARALHATYVTTFGCDSIVNLNLRFFSRPHTEFNIMYCDSYTWNDSTYAQTGNYTQHFQTVHGCDSTVTLHLTINSNLTSEFSITHCDSYTWNGSTYTQTGNYVQHLQTIHGCDSTVTLHLTINNSHTSEFSITHCGSYTWNDSTYTQSGNYVQYFQMINGCDSTVILHLTINNVITNNISAVACDSFSWGDTIYDHSGVYTRHYQSVHLCDSTVILHLTVNHSFTATYYDTICRGEDYLLHGFNIPSQSTMVMHNMVKIRHAVSLLTGCDSTVTLYLTIDQLSVSVSEQLPEHCGHQDGGATVQAAGSVGALTYDWGSIQNTQDNKADSLAHGDYSMTVSDAFCSLSLPIHIYELPLPVACFHILPSGNSYSFGTVLQFWDCSDNADLWHWDLGNGEVSHEQNMSYSYPQVGVYTVSLSVNDAFGCSDTTSQSVEVREEMRIYIPNSFSPNGDGLNDVFKPQGIQISEENYRFVIYNRWGEMVFMTTDLNQGWNGTIHGKTAEEGTVWTYLLHYQNKDGRKFVREGKLTIL